MTLLEYLKETNQTIKDFAISLGYTRVHISNIIHKKCGASRGLRDIVYSRTKGKVIL